MTDTLRRVTVTAVTGLGLCLTLLPAGQAHAQTQTQQAPTRVPCNDIAALKSAIERANTSGGSIALAPRCVYSLTQADNEGDGLPEITGNVRIYGDNTTVERNSAAGFRIFHVRQSGSLSLKSLTVRGGETSTAGGAHGGGIFNDRGTLSLTDSTVRGNRASTGGGIWNQLGTLDLRNTYVRDNRATFGGGVATNGKTTMRGGALRDNTGGFWGGGLANAGETRLNHVSVDGNDSGEYGGGIVTLAINNETGPLRMSFTRIKDNIARTDGGGLLTGADEPTTLYRSTVTRNTANGGPTAGGGIENSGRILRLFIGTTGTRHEQSKGNSTKQTPHTVNLIRSAVFNNHPTDCAPPRSVPRCDAVASTPGTNTGDRQGS
ncbi:hypothetical protein [Streptomyces marispadix]|uniref:CSLREA domain-containing protein n=1 Tax=Streptomyces marispadix TaxID=2922868 RepID=A0ABS9SXW5_9ACTN|nr:hypothetical protein [Streptomyces marispadix]MCH6161119.1 hypothetical protein [Streptomyces marispadix]